MLPRNFYLQYPKGVSIFKNNAITHKRRTSNFSDGDDNLESVRQNLHRKCKTNQPYYGVDLIIEEESREFRMERENVVLGLAAASTIQAQGNQKRQPKRKSTIATTKKSRGAKERMNFPTTILSWLIEMKVVKKNEKVTCFYGTQKEETRVGTLTKNGIICDCCKKMLSAYNFLNHGDGFGMKPPYEEIFIKDMNVSLLTCQIEAWSRHSVPARSDYQHFVKRPRVQDHYDDCCVICADGGDLLCCENCPSTYHSICMGFKDLPQGNWHCPYCRCKYCDQGTSDDLLLTCLQCSKKFHPRCTKENGKIDMWIQPRDIPLCEKRCYKVYQGLKEKLGRRIQLKHGYSWTLVRRINMDLKGENSNDLNLKTTCNSLVVIASRLMEESFNVIIDRQTKTNLIQSVVYNCGSNFTRTNFMGFYTAVLDRDGEIISVASLRIPSPKIAEIPFIATSKKHRNKGMCKLLLGAIESELSLLRVERIIIPSAQEMVKHWQKKFGFVPLDEVVKTEIINLNTLMFPKTTRLQKLIPNIFDLNSPPPRDDQIGK